ncbi:glycosyltransferase [Reyranella sp.]|uniref:glycosyltransferase n=1 Tax=Reyranella sp. TaxID=1929291 RepID=UPI00271980B6|nr:glycosyltransferase [Reyranella sp.]MDO8973674.1 glycosyltransferase [Reyranella sp.]
MTSPADEKAEATGSRLRVVHCVGFYFPDSTGGTEVYVRDLVSALSRYAVDSTIIAATDGDYHRYSWNGVEVVRYPIDAPEVQRVRDKDVRKRRTMFQEIVEATKPDLFHLHSWTIGAGLRHLRQVARMGIPSVVTMHVPSPICMRGTMLLNDERPCDGRIDDRRCARCWALDRGLPAPAAYLVSRLPRWDVTDSVVSRLSPRAATLLSARAAAATKARQLRSMAALSERIVAPSEWVRAALSENAIPPEKVVVSGQSASAEFSDRKQRPLQGGNRREIVIGFLGRLERYKGADLLVRALARLPADLPVLLRIAGVGQDARFARRMEEATRKDSRIQLMGLVEHEMVPEFLADIDVLAVPSRYMETGPIVVQEARALGIPVMGADLGGISERVHHGLDGWLLPFDDPGPWAEAIRVAATDRAEVARLSSNMRRTRSIDDVASEMATLYREIMADRPKVAEAWS